MFKNYLRIDFIHRYPFDCQTVSDSEFKSYSINYPSSPHSLFFNSSYFALCRTFIFPILFSSSPSSIFMINSSNKEFSNQKPSLLLNLDCSTYWWICSASTGSSTTSFTLKEAYLVGSKSAGLSWKAPFLFLHALTSET